jgi:LSD1 subclass zinc finger protein
MQTAEENTGTKIELKYCEGCGTLRLRAAGSERVYCASCWQILREMAGARRKDRRPS